MDEEGALVQAPLIEGIPAPKWEVYDVPRTATLSVLRRW